MYFPDLSPYEYFEPSDGADVVNIGWLDDVHEFRKGKVSERLLEKLLCVCFNPENQTRGFHQSPFVTSSSHELEVHHCGKEMLLGSAEIRVPARSTRVYAAPNLIYHYVRDCGYLPLEEFLEALDRTVCPHLGHERE